MQGAAPGPVETGEGNSSRKRPAIDDDARYASSTTPTPNDSTLGQIPGGAVQPVETGEDNRLGKQRCTERSIRNAFPSTTPDGARTNHAAHNSGPSADGVHDAASLKGAKTVFKAEVMDSITRRPCVRDPWTTEWVADITLFLQKSEVRNRFGCQMDIGIAKEKVAYYAKKLCEVDIEIIDELRYIRYPNGSKIEPDPSIKLRAIRPDAILEIFGKEIFDGFSSAPIRRHEEEQARDRTDGASMTISNRDRECGKITLYIGDYHAFRLRDALYPPREMETLTVE
ncbi:hypothetical protein NKR19_g8170 [Coniochaeta hoffmannii]|uniref:Uncharacterized protein n=1 Tax=Coniochaeta hoffmannii TaxID=91930 RepID=A0AA38RP09_9PEZI|nr:hypothetical protein NKR19_g8170 [Coniochaeta hoffmannii]